MLQVCLNIHLGLGFGWTLDYGEEQLLWAENIEAKHFPLSDSQDETQICILFISSSTL